MARDYKRDAFGRHAMSKSLLTIPMPYHFSKASPMRGYKAFVKKGAKPPIGTAGVTGNSSHGFASCAVAFLLITLCGCASHGLRFETPKAQGDGRDHYSAPFETVPNY